MTFNIEIETNIELDVDYRKIGENVIEAVLDSEKCPYETEVSLIITDDEQIHSINKEYRNIERSTDVLSFPMIEYSMPSDFSHVENSVEDYFNPETGELILGDIIISAEKVIEQANSYGHSVLREYAFLIVHSMLHLCGYDHMEDEEAKVMEEKQNEILTILNINR